MLLLDTFLRRDLLRQSFLKYCHSHTYAIMAAFFLSAVLVISLYAEDAKAASDVVAKSQIDQREYAYFVLPNELPVLLISDKNTDKAAASLDVHVGSSDDPKDRAGLAHFLEHMLFLGTEKYPDASDYQAFISRNGGGHNAYTSAEHTNYFFDIDASQLEPALDRFAQFFIAPLFDEIYVDRERNAVHSEYQARIKDDDRRGYDVYREVMNPEHPYSRFSVGSLTTLADRPNDKVRDDLLSFYRQHYSAEKMRLVVLGKENIPQLKAMVRQRFSEIPLYIRGKLKSDAEEDNGTVIPLFPDNTLPIEVVSRPVKDLRKMSMLFPLSSLEAYHREKPLSYIGSLLGHEGQGSLLSVLKKQGWAEGLSAGGSRNSGAGNSAFHIVINLTPEGLKHRNKVRALVFHAIRIIRAQGINEWRYAEQQQVANIAFEFRENSKPINTVRSLANNLHEYSVSEVISAPYLYKNFDPELIDRVLSMMTPENLYLHTVFPDAKTTQKSAHYHTPYRVNQLDKSLASVLPDILSQYQLPKKNIFVASSSELYSVDKRYQELTLLPASINNVSELWVKQDHDFGVPKAHVSLRVQLPSVSRGVRASALNHLLIAMISDRLNESSYPAAIAGLSYSLVPNSRGFDISVDGYDNKMQVLLSMVLDQIRQASVKSARFDSMKSEVLRQLQNAQQQPPFRRVMGQLPVSLFRPYWSNSQLIAAMQRVTFDDLVAFSQQWLQGARVKGLLYGNIHQAMINQWALSISRLPVMSEKTVAKSHVVKLPLLLSSDSVSTQAVQRAITVDHNDKAVALYVQGTSDNLDDQAKMVLLRQVLETPFYNQLRTQKQLGYIVFLTSLTIKDVPGSVFIVQSPSTSLNDIQQAITQFMGESITIIPEDLSVFKASAATKLLEKPQKLSGQASRYWQEILRGDGQVNYRQRLVDAIDTINSQQLRDYYRRTLLNAGQHLWILADKSIIQDDRPLFTDRSEFYTYP